MALLTTPYDPTAAARVLVDAIQTGQRARQAEMAQIVELAKEQQRNNRRASEFAQQLAFNEAKDAAVAQRYDLKEAEDRRRWDFENTPTIEDPTPLPAPSSNLPKLPPVPRAEAVNPTAAMKLLDPFLDTPLSPGAPTTGNLDTQTLLAPETSPAAGLPTLTAAPQGAPVTPGAVPLPAGPTDLFPADIGEIGPRLGEIRKALAATPMTPKARNAAIAAAAAAISSRKPTETHTTNVIDNWPTNEQGYKFDPQSPERMFEVKSTGPKGTVYGQVKATDPYFGLQAVGDGLWEDKNGARFFVEKMANGKPTLKRTEEDEKIKSRTTDSKGRIHSYNAFGAEVSITDEKFNFLSQKSKLMAGSDGKLYAYDSNTKPLQPIPPGVTFGSAPDMMVQSARVGSDGVVYAWNKKGVALTPIPDGVRFDKQKDPEAVAHWEVDEKTGDLHGFNFKGDKIAANEGDYAKIREAAMNRNDQATMSDSALYETLSPPVKNLQSVYDTIKAAGANPHASHEDLVKALGERGAALSKQRQDAQHLANTISVRGKTVKAQFAEGFVKAYEGRYQKPAAQVPGQPPAAPAAPAPAAPPATPPAGETVWREKDGVLWEFDVATKKATGKYVDQKKTP